MAQIETQLPPLLITPQEHNTRCSSAPCVPIINGDMTRSLSCNKHLREDSDGSDKIVRSVGGGSQSGLSSEFDDEIFAMCSKYRNGNMRLPSPCGSVASYCSSIREDELESEIIRIQKVKTKAPKNYHI